MLSLDNGGLEAKLDTASGNFEGDLTLPKSKLRFKLFGLLPASAKVVLDDIGGTNGTVRDGKVTANSQVSIKLVDVRMLGLPLLYSNSCQTVAPADVDVESGSNFDPLTGGTLTGEYTIPEFSGCGFITGFINGMVPGPGNTLELNIDRR
ncbi:hypothetical protein GCM10027521_55770 [Amycolatopsis cihanbeyliensis]